jgi:hypothetical protein
MKAILFVLSGIAVGCAAATVSRSASTPARAAEVVQQYCTTSGDYNNVQAVDDLVKRAGREGWELVGVYRAAPLGATREDYVCFKR